MFHSRCIAGALVLFGGFLKAAGALAATLSIAVQTSDGRPLGGAVLTVHALNAPGRPAVPVNAIMDQVDRAFIPDLLVIPAGSTVELPNSDSVNHQIYSFSAAKKFQLPLYHGKPYPPVRFDQVGFVTLGCNIHDSMLAYVVVTDAPYFGRTDSKGSWSVEVPRGTYRVTVWHPRLRENAELGREVQIGDADRTAIAVRLAKSLQPAPLDGHHSWDAY
ncbi:MAG: methylamine utilization protein [Gammaproteobacteria bacterium]|nr:methylamine utilization protein [Gammaproteobacteria bacterium]